MKCENVHCDKDHDGSFGGGRFCSKSCANSRSFSEVSRLKKSLANKRRVKESGPWGGQVFFNHEKFRKTWKEKLQSRSWEELGKDSRRNRVILEQEGSCGRCGANEWQGELLTLEIEHVNGNSSDCSRENMIALCPNCHSITNTWRGRNKQSNRGKYTDLDVWEEYKRAGNIRQALISLGYAGKGSNYTRVKRVIKKFEMLEQLREESSSSPTTLMKHNDEV